MQIKVLTYNLFWWSLFDLRKGNDASAGKLIAKATRQGPFDFMGFQECNSVAWVLGDAGLQAQFTGVQGSHAKCMAFRKNTWSMISHGDVDMAADVPWNSYGTRGSQWLRAQHLVTGQKVFFMNHHGPLSVNSGGACGGESTAHSLLQVMAANAEPGDTIILVGDFNANAASLTIRELRSHLLHVFNGVSFGGVDNIFSNVAGSQVLAVQNLGPGGSDHDALAAVIGEGPAERGLTVQVDALRAASALIGPGAPGWEWALFWCGLEENDVEYAVESSSWQLRVGSDKAPSPDWCCRLCQGEKRCQAWRWMKGEGCMMQDGQVSSRVSRADVVSGLPAARAATLVVASSSSEEFWPMLAAP